MVKTSTSPNEESKTVVTVNEMKVNGHHLVQWKQKFVVNTEGTIKISRFIHSRAIDDRNYTVEESDNIVLVETQMTQEELEKFEEDWSNLWNPQATLLE